MGRVFASQSGVIAQTDLVDRARPNEMEFSGERSEVRCSAPGMGAEQEVEDLEGP